MIFSRRALLAVTTSVAVVPPALKEQDMPPVPKLRVARPTTDIMALLPFYTKGLPFELLLEFKNHEGFDGVMLGAPDSPYHLEFTFRHGHTALRAPDAESLLVFYLETEAEWGRSMRRMEAAGFSTKPSVNPYWDRVGATFEDPDGYRIVLSRERWDH